MNRKIFVDLIRIFNNDFIFHNDFICFQAFVNEQLHLIFYKFDNFESISDFVKTTNNWNISKNHVYNCTRRMILIFCNLKKQYIKWSNSKQKIRENMKNKKRVDFIEYVNKINDIDIFLINKSIDAFVDETFFNKKKKQYVMNLCIIYDFSLKFIYIYIDWSNFVHDNRIFKTMNIFNHSKRYFDKDEYLLENKIYKHIFYMIISYIDDERHDKYNKCFNKLFFNIRIDIKHCFDILKKRWNNFEILKFTFRTQKQYKYMIQ